jgi:hypothetical protein
MDLGRRPANQDMIDGYMDGRDADSPPPSGNRSHSYKHGWAVGRSELDGRSLGAFHAVVAASHAAMDMDEQR